jgi:demethylmenaquinone methyltransferase/2-methoxy-6-polyprenyl-1,4-benzoquinol methylase
MQHQLKQTAGQEPTFSANESARNDAFSGIWTEELNDAFADIAKYYDRANHVASFGLWNWLQSSFISSIDVKPDNKVLDVCAGTMAVSIALLQKEPNLDVHAVDRSAEMLAVGSRKTSELGIEIKPEISDVHQLPYPDNTFDVVTIQYASRHLQVIDVFTEVQRVLVPGGHFYHCDMLRPGNKIVETLYYMYLRACLSFTAFLFRSHPAAQSLKRYFIDALQMFYSADDLTSLLEEIGFKPVHSKSLLLGMIGIHNAMKKEPD